MKLFRAIPKVLQDSVNEYLSICEILDNDIILETRLLEQRAHQLDVSCLNPKHSLLNDVNYEIKPPPIGSWALDALVARLIVRNLPMPLLSRPFMQYLSDQSLEVKYILYPTLIKQLGDFTRNYMHEVDEPKYYPLKYFLSVEVESPLSYLDFILTIEQYHNVVINYLPFESLGQHHTAFLLNHPKIPITPDVIIGAIRIGNDHVVRVLVDRMMSKTNQRRIVEYDILIFDETLNVMFLNLSKHTPGIFKFVLNNISDLDCFTRYNRMTARQFLHKHLPSIAC